jgi:hypothetical protein
VSVVGNEVRASTQSCEVAVEPAEIDVRCTVKEVGNMVGNVGVELIR